jgi:hypothetical protein
MGDGEGFTGSPDKFLLYNGQSFQDQQSLLANAISQLSALCVSPAYRSSCGAGSAKRNSESAKALPTPIFSITMMLCHDEELRNLLLLHVPYGRKTPLRYYK